eukprot:TRINITY_DN2115_c0_g1_i1.p1 TRINITY_DN2115_c0_g1~~TRINITY_DN2115_c0_g1_i1.p1  ORF type:complete len:148 (+),score=35.71 TRINITY_DN2115_c0_g1_i1:55-498(+)
MADYEPQLRSAAQRGNASMLGNLIRDRIKEGMNLNSQDGLGNTALHYSAHHGFPTTLGMLLDAGADPNVQNAAGETPLHKALLKDGVPSVELLMSHGANPTIANKDGKTATHLAKSAKCKELIKKRTNVAVSKIDMSMLADSGDTDD